MAHTYTFNTKQRDGGTNADSLFYVDYADHMFGGTKKLFLHNVVLMNHMYPISAARENNTLTYRLGGGAVNTVIIPDGFYTGITMADTLGPLMKIVTPGVTFTWTHDPFNLRLSFSLNAATTVQFTSNDNSINDNLGIEPTTVYTTVVDVPQVLPYPVELRGTHTIYLETNLVSTRSFSTKTPSSIFCEIPVLVPFGEQITHIENLRIMNDITKLNSVRFRLLDDNGSQLELFPNSYVSYTFVVLDGDERNGRDNE